MRFFVAVVAACGVLAAGTGQAEDFRIGGTGGSLGAMRLVAEAYHRSQSEYHVVVLPSLGSGGGIKALLAGAIEVALSARPLTPEEANAGASLRRYARTPLVFATNQPGVVSVTARQVVDIYSGSFDAWRNGTRIRLVVRPPVEADSDLLRAFSPAMRDALSLAEKRPGMVTAATDQDNGDRLEKMRGAFGAIPLAQIVAERRELLPLAFDGKAPVIAGKPNRDYPLMKSLYLVTGPATGAAGRSFVAFLESRAGREVLERSGHLVD
jgi:phosphate transport system substrate-binding protein